MRAFLPKIAAFTIVNLELALVALAQAQTQEVTLKNPLEADTFAAIIEKITEIVMIVALPVIVLFIVYAGFLYVTAQGNEKKLKEAHDTLLWSVIGAGIILGAFVIATAIDAFVQTLR